MSFGIIIAMSLASSLYDQLDCQKDGGQERLRIFEEKIESMRYVAESSGDTKAKEIYGLLKARLFASRPIGTKVEDLENVSHTLVNSGCYDDRFGMGYTKAGNA